MALVDTVFNFSVTSGTRSENWINWAEIREKIPANTVTTTNRDSRILNILFIFRVSKKRTMGFISIAKNAEKASGMIINLP